jgi:hypothetical protein
LPLEVGNAFAERETLGQPMKRIRSPPRPQP